MSTDEHAESPTGFLSRERTIAPPGFNRWLVPPAALAIHLAIGEVYAFSVFKLPLTHLRGGDEATAGNWTQGEVGWIFSLAIVFLGLSAAIFGQWLERVGPRRAMFTSACCFGAGFLVSAVGVLWHQLWLLYLGYGVLGGIGLGLGYISPVSTLIKWFPDRPGLATGLAIMGFGGGAMIGSPLSNALMAHFRTDGSPGVAEAFATLGVVYFLFMLFGVVTVRVPAKDWKPVGWARPAGPKGDGMDANQAIRTPQFWLLWVVLFANVTAGIGVLEQASPMIQEMFPGAVTAVAAGGFVGLLSLFNMVGRFGWSSTSDTIGRKPTYAIFFALGATLYVLTPQAGNVALFVLGYGIILSMYGGGFATIPAYLRDRFGTLQVGAIHGRLLTAWSCAGVAGPLLVNQIRERQIEHGVPKAEVYTAIMYLMAGLLVVGFVCNLLVRPTAVTPQPGAGAGKEPGHDESAAAGSAAERSPAVVAARWLYALVPLGWGVWQTVQTSLALFR